ncbi:hypothetical protein [Solilutibacter silvestris]|nr:hypothetical protein [Lysobacter silvestris]
MPNYRAANISTYGYAIPGAGKLPAFTRYNGSVNDKMDNGIALSFMVNNLTGKMAPRNDTYLGTSTAPYNSANFNLLGHSYYVQAHWDIGATKKSNAALLHSKEPRFGGVLFYELPYQLNVRRSDTTPARRSAINHPMPKTGAQGVSESCAKS